MIRKQNTRAWLLSLAALVLLMSNYFVGWAEEPDPRILWVADSSIGGIHGFAVHPNGNIFVYRNGFKDGNTVKSELQISEIDGTNGKLLRKLPKISNDVQIESIDISDDGKYLATSYDGVTIIDLSDLSSKTFGNGNRVTFVPNSKKVAYRASSGGTIGHDSSIVILDLETQERSYIKTEEMIHKISFSPDGRFFATGGSGKDVYGKSYTSLKLWDANTLKLIKELERLENVDYNFQRIEFSNNNKYVAFLPYNGKLLMFTTENASAYREYDEDKYKIKAIGKFCFINDSLIAFSTLTPSTFIWNFDKDAIAFDVANYMSPRGLYYSNKLDIIILGTNTQLIAFDMKKILSNVTENPIDLELKSEYQKGMLLISGIELINNSVNLEIFDINGKLVHQLNIEPNGTELRIPIVLAKGTYLLNLTDGNKKYSSKFIVTE